MSLATRCTSCGTVFRVVQDQLKVSEGWVRCGRCDAVFNALEGLFDLGRDAPPDWDPTSPSPALAAAAAADNSGAAPAPAGPDVVAAPVAAVEEKGHSSSFPSTAPAALDDLLADPIDAHLFRKRGAETEKRPSTKVDERDRHEFSDARFDSDLFAENAAAGETELLESPTTDAADLPLERASQLPDFIRRAERRARWRSAPARMLLAATSTLALVLLVAQIGHHFRDTFAARWPASRPVFTAWCKLADCALEAPRRIDEVLVDSTALTRAIGLDAFVLSVTLKSRSALPLVMPSIDLSLTDGNGRLVARRALAPRDFGAAGIIQPGAEAALQLMLNTGSARIAGYTVEIFYP
jgi:predicted Zn finger-like uncharacterized protein